MRTLNKQELTAISGGTLSACNPLVVTLGFFGGLLKLVTTGKKSPGKPCGCGSTPTTPPVEA